MLAPIPGFAALDDRVNDLFNQWGIFNQSVPEAYQSQAKGYGNLKDIGSQLVGP